jgi:hypothetical protein
MGTHSFENRRIVHTCLYAHHISLHRTASIGIRISIVSDLCDHWSGTIAHALVLAPTVLPTQSSPIQPSPAQFAMSLYRDDTDSRALHFRDAGCDYNWDRAEKACAALAQGGDLLALLSWQTVDSGSDSGSVPRAKRLCQPTYQGYLPLAWVEECTGVPIVDYFRPTSVEMLIMRTGSCITRYMSLDRDRFLASMLVHAQKTVRDHVANAALVARRTVGRRRRLVYTECSVATITV